MMSTQEHEFEWNDIYTGETCDLQEPDPVLLEIIGRLDAGRALDVGCGAGGLLATLAARDWQVSGIDIAPKAIEAAKKVLAARGLRAELHVADAGTWKPAGQYDLVTCSFALPDQREGQARFYQMARRALAPGGTVLIKDFDASMKRHEVFSRFHCPTVEELLVAFDGFEIIRAEVVETPAHGDGPGPWTAALLQARKR